MGPPPDRLRVAVCLLTATWGSPHAIDGFAGMTLQRRVMGALLVAVIVHSAHSVRTWPRDSTRSPSMSRGISFLARPTYAATISA
jgi:hypothetical protein